MKEYLILLAQVYPEFRLAELEALADLHGIDVDLSQHDPTRPFLKVQLENDCDACSFISRAVLSKAIYEVWGEGESYDTLHQSVKHNSGDRFDLYKKSTFRFDFEGYKGRQNSKAKRAIIESFGYLNFEGAVDLKNPEECFTILEEYEVFGMEKADKPKYIWFGRLVSLTERTEKNVVETYDLKKRGYIGTTSFDAELSLVTCNLAHVTSGHTVYDPFTGTGSFMVTAAHFGALAIGSDIDVRMLSGNGSEQNVKSNFKDYGTYANFIDVLTMDFTHNALRKGFGIDTIICDPPYGVREGLRVLGAKNEEKAAGREKNVVDGEIAHLRRDFVPPKKPYELSDMLDDLLSFAGDRLPVGGKLAFWMPTANDDFSETIIPQHERLKLQFNLEQEFHKWSRRLLVYVKMDESYAGETRNGLKELNIKNFRERYFKGFSERSR
ncbi:Trm11 protein [Candida orthopsilosis Co 90-125]|uniref:tRNA (guanine(10)-N(2))-methyltransferase n=1 Tax=Candida orthopsilosis (strain 90-125) TaxID=1136231 RepID=H8X2Z2_CANO9|nr:Trm11 protein [Candida orthopsilosis Co 90-125]CCG25852.1 Trm11 protein [Candida orthopsilosis Co 90-125]